MRRKIDFARCEKLMGLPRIDANALELQTREKLHLFYSCPFVLIRDRNFFLRVPVKDLF